MTLGTMSLDFSFPKKELGIDMASNSNVFKRRRTADGAKRKWLSERGKGKNIQRVVKPNTQIDSNKLKQ